MDIVQMFDEKYYDEINDIYSETGTTKQIKGVGSYKVKISEFISKKDNNVVVFPHLFQTKANDLAVKLALEIVEPSNGYGIGDYIYDQIVLIPNPSRDVEQKRKMVAMSKKNKIAIIAEPGFTDKKIDAQWVSNFVPVVAEDGKIVKHHKMTNTFYVKVVEGMYNNEVTYNVEGYYSAKPDLIARPSAETKPKPQPVQQPTTFDSNPAFAVDTGDDLPF